MELAKRPIELTRLSALPALTRSLIEGKTRAGSLSPERAISEGLQLSAFRRLDPELARMAILNALVDLVTDVDAKKTIDTELRFFDLAETILESYWTYKFAEILLVFDKIRAGKYGKIYERLDEAFILEAFRIWDVTERENWAAGVNQRLAAESRVAHNWPDQEAYLKAVKIGRKLAGEIVKIREDKKRSEEDYSQFKSDYIRNKPPGAVNSDK